MLIGGKQPAQTIINIGGEIGLRLKRMGESKKGQQKDDDKQCNDDWMPTATGEVADDVHRGEIYGLDVETIWQTNKTQS